MVKFGAETERIVVIAEDSGNESSPRKPQGIGGLTPFGMMSRWLEL